MRKIRNIFIIILVVFGNENRGFAQDSINIDGVFVLKNDKNVKIIIKNGRFVYIDSRQNGDLASPCCDTITYGYVKVNSDGYLEFESDSSLNSIFVSMDVTEKVNRKTDSIFFIITNPIEEHFKNRKSKEKGDLSYTLLVYPKSSTSSYFKENTETFERGFIKYYNPDRLAINDFTITIEPKNSMYVKNIAVRALSTTTYKVRNSKANIFEINIPQLSYGFISYRRIEGSFAQWIEQNVIIWEGKEFIKSK